MKLLFDQNISHRLISRIQDILPNSKQVRELNLENSTDREIWGFAKENGFTKRLIRLKKFFGSIINISGISR